MIQKLLRPDNVSTLDRVRFALADPKALAFRVTTRYGLIQLARELVRRPQTFNDHVRHRMIHDRSPIHVVMADKIEVKDYVESRIGAGYTARTYAVGGNPNEIDFDSLPRNYVVKVNHASGGVILVSETFHQGQQLPTGKVPLARFRLHPHDVDVAAIKAALGDWLQEPYGANKSEWAYTRIAPAIMVEEYLENPSNYPPTDYKFFVFHGRCEAVRVDRFDDSGKSYFHFTRDGEFIPVRLAEFAKPLLPMNHPLPSLPGEFARMRELAETLSNGMDFLRVDMFEIEGRLVVGELTLYPTAGAARFVPKAFDRQLGQFWRRT